MRLIDFLKRMNITAVFTHFILGSSAAQDVEVGVSSLMIRGSCFAIRCPANTEDDMWNPLSNAVKFTANGGRISVTAEQRDQHIRIEVADTGIGIDPAFLPHVFDRFRQADSTTTRRFGGLGLGLAIVHDLMRLHGGHVDVRSSGIGQGATFAVTFRASDAPAIAADPSRPAVKTISLKGYRIMLLEDHADSRELLVEALRGTPMLLQRAGSTDRAGC